MTKRKPSAAASLANLDQYPKPADASSDRREVVNFSAYSDTIAQLASLVESSGTNRSRVIRAAIAFAHARKEEFLAEAFGDE